MGKGFSLSDMLADAKACNARLAASGGIYGHESRMRDRRAKVSEYMDLGLGPKRIAEIMGENQSTISTDIRAIINAKRQDG